VPKRRSLGSGHAAQLDANTSLQADRSWPLAVILAEPSKCLPPQSEEELPADDSSAQTEADAQTLPAEIFPHDDSNAAPSFFVAETAFDSDESESASCEE
jgi:hypothetical protein